MISDPTEDYQKISNFNDSEQIGNQVLKGVSEEKISLLEERLIVDFVRRKVGEIVIRKEIDTCILQVEVPVRREKLIVEQVSPDYKRLAEIDLGQEPNLDEAIVNSGIDRAMLRNLISIEHDVQHLSIDRPQPSQKRIQRTFDSIESAKSLLDAIAAQFDNNSETINIEIVLKDLENQKIYQSLFDREYSNDQ